MKKINYPLVIIIVAIVAAFIVVAVVNLKSPKDSGQTALPQTTEKNAQMQKSDNMQPENTALEPLPTDSKQAVDSEIKAIDAEINSLSDENVDDLSGVENEL